jgi:hypothetical protein
MQLQREKSPLLPGIKMQLSWLIIDGRILKCAKVGWPLSFMKVSHLVQGLEGDEPTNIKSLSFL